MYKDKLADSLKWIDSYNTKIKKFGQVENTKDALEKQLEEIQVCNKYFIII